MVILANMLYWNRGDYMDKFTGLLTKIKVIKEKPLLLRFTLVSANESVNCLVVREMLSRHIMMLPDDKYTMSVKGYFNSKNQLVIKEMRILDKNEFTHKLGLWRAIKWSAVIGKNNNGNRNDEGLIDSGFFILVWASKAKRPQLIRLRSGFLVC